MQKNHISKALYALVLGLYLSFGVFNSALASNSVNIKDVDSSDPKLGIYLDLLNDQSLTLDNLGNLRPNLPINKAAFIKAALTYTGFKPTTGFNFFTGYSDVPEESWFAPYVKKALDSQIITNQLNDKFFPDKTLTRQDALLLVMDIYGLPTPLTAPKVEDLYSDIRLNHPLASIYAAAKTYKIYFEDTQKEFFPSKILTRGDAADLLFKAKLAAFILKSNNPDFDSVQPILPNFYLNQDIQDGNDFVSNDKFPILMDAWTKINNQYANSQQVNRDQLVYHAIKGMVDSLNDPYSTFKTPDNNGNSFIYIPENYEGIGAVIDFIDGNYIVETTITNSPAYRAGLQPKDIVLKIAGQAVKTLNPEQITNLIKGKAGSVLALQIKRGAQIIDFKIPREKITVESIQTKDLGNGINYIRIDQFTESSAAEFAEVIKTIQAGNSKKLIIDLRNNPGGYLTSAQGILNHFLDQEKIDFITNDKFSNNNTYYSSGPGELQGARTVILINEGSASASEIFAGALQDYQLAYIIGTTSFGKGSVQEITNYDDNSSLKLTIAHWLTPNKRDINHLGIVPDQIVTISDLQKENGQDPQLDAAVNYLR